MNYWLSRLSILRILCIWWLIKKWSVWSLLRYWSYWSSTCGLVLIQWELVGLVSATIWALRIILEVFLEHILYLIYSLTVINKLHAFFITILFIRSVSPLFRGKCSLNRATTLSKRPNLALWLVNSLLDFYIYLGLRCLKFFPHVISEIFPYIQKIIVRLRRNKC